jgi:hypothetical protein
MDIDLDKIFPPGETQKKKPQRSDYATGVMPGFYTIIFFVVPFFFYYFILRKAIHIFADPQNITEINIIVGIFFLFTLALGIMSDIKQPFNPNTNRQKKKGRILRFFAFMVMMVYLMTIVGIAYYSYTHFPEVSEYQRSILGD